MGNVSLKEQLQAVAAELSDKLVKEHKSEHKPKSEQKSKLNPPKHVEKSYSLPNTAKPKPKWLDYVQYGVELMKVYFPECFKSANDVRPLKKGIKQDLVKRLSTIETIVTEDKACMVKSLAYYVNTAAYHKSVVEGAIRVDLDGNPVGVVSADEAKYSVERHQAKQQAKLIATSHKEANRKEQTP